MNSRSAWRPLALTALLSAAAGADEISFKLEQTPPKLTVVNTGSAAADFPVPYRLQADGRWVPLASYSGELLSYLPPGTSLAFKREHTRGSNRLSALESARPVMVRFFDRAGGGFGQVSFFDRPRDAAEGLRAGYAAGGLALEAPKDARISATWVLWAQEE